MKRQVKMLWLSLQETRYYIYSSAIIFVLSMFMGYHWDKFHLFLEIQMAGISDIAEEIIHADNPLLTMLTFIFVNNAVKAVAVVFLGFILGVLPIIFLVINGMMLGYLYLDVVVLEEQFTTWQMIVGIMPHGIIELPIIIIACAYGLRLGALALGTIIRSKRVVPGSIGRFMRATPRLVAFIVISLFVAALIESFITPILLGISFK